jgi:uncharacterized protein (PEP-CTERM system associated)
VPPPSGSTGLGGTSAQLPPDFLTNPSVVERYLLRRSIIALTFDLPRTTLSVIGFDDLREDRLRLDGTPLPDESQTALTLSASRRFGARTSLVLEITDSRTDSAETAATDWQSQSLITNYDVGPRTRLSLAYMHTSQDSSVIGAAYNYAANVVTLLVTRTFNASVHAK